ncbi:MAG: ubiquitin-like domain-containing protein [Eubacteriales bacterium]|nr:ubiquitin-like domain-containing protein [Eubacteriales bacterium]
MKERLQKMRWLFGAGMLCAIALTGCNKTMINVTVLDGNTETQMQIADGATVAQAMQEAEIIVGEKDEIQPAMGELVTESDAVITIRRYAKIQLVEDDVTTEVEAQGETVEDLINREGIVIGEHDYVDHDFAAYLQDGMTLQVVHRLEVFVNVDGETNTYLTRAKNVEELLAEQKITIDKKDRVKPELSQPLEEGDKVTIERVSVKEIVEKEPVDFGTKIEYSNTMYTDQTSEKTPGVKGEKEVTYKVTYVDGKEEKRKFKSEKITKEPVAQVIVQGTKKRRTVVSRENVPDCDGSGHGYYVITWSDGTVEYQDY